MWMAPFVLLGLAGIALPLWLHRFARQTEQKQPFASLMFLEPSEVRRSRRHELRYWLLLALRLLLLALVVLAFAGPLWRMAATAGPASSSTLHVIVLDTSLSMNRGDTWQRAQARSRELIAGLRGPDRAMVVAADHRLRVMQEPVFPAQRGLLVAAVEGLAPGAARLDYGMLMAGSASWGANQSEQVRLHLITDLQSSASPMRFADLQPPAGVTLELIDAGADTAPNLAVTGIEVPERDPAVALVRVAGDAASLAGRELVLEVNGIERGRRKLDASTLADAGRVERFDIGDPGPGEHRLAARLMPADGLPQDDVHYALLRRVQPRVLVVAATTSADDATYLRAALESLAAPRFQVEIGGAPALATRSLEGFSAIIVSDAGVLDADAANGLRRYIEGGGATLLTLGPRALQAGGDPLTGAKLADGRARTAGNALARVSEMEQSHPVLREAAGWRAIHFLRHVPVTPPRDAKALMQFDNGSPLLLEQSLGRGRALVFTSALAREWNDLAIHPLFVRFVAESATYLAGARAAAATAIVGEPVDATASGRGGGQVFDPAGRRALVLQGTAGTLRLVPAEAGFYEVRGGGRSDYIAVNPDARESRLERLAPAVVERWLALSAPAVSSGAGVGEVRVADPAPVRLIPVWFWLLLGAALLAFLEPLVANYHLHVLRERRE